MSCTEVMYQPYSPYFPYHQRAAAAAASCPGAGTASGIAAAQAACLDYKRFVSPKMHDLLAGSAAMAASSPATPPSSLQSLGPPRSTSSAGSSSSHHSRNHHHNHHSGSTTANNSVNSGGNSSGHHGSSGRSSSSSSACAVAASSSPSTPLAARSPDREESSVQASKATSSSSLPGGHTAAAQAVVTGGGGSSPSSAAVTGGTSASPGDAHYVSANCVVFTYYSGDISSVVDEHFSRALSESGAYDGTAGSSCKSGASQLKDAPPMSQRNFPASFWDCHQSGGSPSHGMSAVGGSAGAAVSSPVDLYAGSEAHPYHHAHHHAASAANAAALHASLQSDPWHYALTAPQAGPYSATAFPRRSSAMHELAYSAGGAAHRFGAQQYGSLLLQPRSSRLAPATCTALDKGDAWASPAARYHHDQLTGHHVVDASGYQAAAHHHYGSMGAAAAAAAMTGLDSQVQETGKDLYWF